MSFSGRFPAPGELPELPGESSSVSPIGSSGYVGGVWGNVGPHQYVLEGEAATAVTQYYRVAAWGPQGYVQGYSATAVKLAQPLDRYSFPSGHCMTFAAVLFPVSLAWPGMFAGLLALWALIAWARLASAHHYVSDVIAGTTLGIVVAWPICGALLD